MALSLVHANCVVVPEGSRLNIVEGREVVASDWAPEFDRSC